MEPQIGISQKTSSSEKTIHILKDRGDYQSTHNHQQMLRSIKKIKSKISEPTTPDKNPKKQGSSIWPKDTIKSTRTTKHYLTKLTIAKVSISRPTLNAIIHNIHKIEKQIGQWSEHKQF